MADFKFFLELYKGPSSRHTCPECKESKAFTLYINDETGKALADHVGRCNREVNCGYHYTPRQYFTDNPENSKEGNTFEPASYRPVVTAIKNTTYIPIDLFKKSLKGYQDNTLAAFLRSKFGEQITNNLIAKYFIGSSKKEFYSHEFPEYKSGKGAVIFWQIDIKGRIRTGKIMLYYRLTGKRVKKPFNHIAWVHTTLKAEEYVLEQCFFGEHLLKDDPSKPVAIVESEKTAIIASVYLPQFTWLATGSISNLSFQKCKALTGRKVILFPDLSCYNKWSEKIEQFSSVAQFSLSDLLERKATEEERKQGLDLADYLLRFDYKEFSNYNLINTDTSVDEPQVVERKDLQNAYKVSEFVKPAKIRWDEELNEIENFLESIELPLMPIKLNSYTTVSDLHLFIDSHLQFCKSNNGNPAYLPYLNRLKELKHILISDNTPALSALSFTN